MTLWQEFRFVIRSLGRSPGFVIIAVVTLGLGIGANTATFSFINEIFLRPLPYPDSGHLDRIYRATPQNSRGAVSPADYRDLTSQMSGYGEIAAQAFSEMSLSAPGEPAEMASGLLISANLLSVLGIEPQLGRNFRSDEVLGNQRVLIISHRCWQNRFGGDARIIGRSVRVDGEAYEIVGVLAANVIAQAGGDTVEWGEIVGVASDIQSHGLLCSWIARDARRCEGSDVRPGAAPDLLLAGGRGWPRSSGVAAAGTYTGLFDPGPHLFS